MNLSKSSVQPLDLDDLERQLREVAVSSLPRRSEDPLAELARIVGRDNAPRAASSQSPDAFRSGAQAQAAPDASAEAKAEPNAYDLEASIKEALRADPAYDAADEHGEEVFEDDEPENDDTLAFGDEAHSPSEEWEEDTYEDEPAYAGEAGRFDEVERVPGAPDDEEADAPVGRRFVSPRALALALPLVLLGVAGGAAVVMRGGPISRSSGEAPPMIKADDAPVKVLPAKAAGDQQTPSETALGAADPSGKPSQVVLADAEQPVDVVAAAKSAQPRDLGVSQPPAGSGIVILSGSGSSGQGAGNAQAAASAPLDGSAASAQPLPTAAANVPLPEPPQPTAQASVFGTPHRVMTVPVKPDGPVVSNGKPKAADIKPVEARVDATAASQKPPLTVASAETTPAASVSATAPSATPTAKKTADTTRPKPSAVTAADDEQATAQSASAQPSVKPAKPVAAKAVKPKPAETASTAQEGETGAPLSITPPGNRGRAGAAKTVVASAEPAKATPVPGASTSTTTAPSNGGFAVQLASSTSENDARATLSRLQKQFPNELGSGAVHRADLGSKGVYYRVQVGPLSREAADKICTQLKAGGAECILTRG